MEVKSLITWPSAEMKLPGPGFYEIRGLAWSGKGRGIIKRVEVTVDGGKTWALASLVAPVQPMAQVRFTYPWVWTGQETVIASRATDDTGYIQPTKQVLLDARGATAGAYHHNGIQEFIIAADGGIKDVFGKIA